MKLNPNIDFENGMGFLNDTQARFPQALSFAAGRPDDQFLHVKEYLAELDTYLAYTALQTGNTPAQVLSGLGQYSRTKGIVNDILAAYLEKDEGIRVDAQEILVTIGAQEAIGVAITTLCDRERDLILAEDPCYIGVKEFVRMGGYCMEGIKSGDEGLDLGDLEKKIVQSRAQGRQQVKVVYVIPNFHNPTGNSMHHERRRRLLQLAEEYDFYILEDAAYNAFTYTQEKVVSLKSIDAAKRVIFIGSFSKTLVPGLRIGMLVADQRIHKQNGDVIWLIDEMAKVKANTTLNTPALNQAILGGVLLKHQYSLENLNKEKRQVYGEKRKAMLDALHQHVTCQDWGKDITWNEPTGGFFLRMRLPFTITNEDVERCAREYGVFFCPMRYFYLGDGGENEIRITFATLPPDQIKEGVKRLAKFLQGKIEQELLAQAMAAKAE